MHTYTNPFHSPQYQGSKPVITTNAAYARGGPLNNIRPPEKTRLQRAGRSKCLATPPGAVPGLHDTENGSK